MGYLIVLLTPVLLVFSLAERGRQIQYILLSREFHYHPLYIALTATWVVAILIVLFTAKPPTK